MSYYDSLQSNLDRFLPSNTQKCDLLSCTPGKVWAVIAGLSIVASMGTWRSFLTSLMWQAIIGLGVLMMCRSCQYKWLWALLILFSGVPLALVVIGTAVVMMTAPPKI